MKSIQLFLKQISSSFFLLSSLCSFIIFAENKCIEIYDPSNKLNLGNINSGHFDKKDGEIIFSYDLNTKKFDKLSFIKQQRGNEALIIKRNGVMYSDVRGYQNKIKPEYDARPHLTVLEMEKTIDGIPKNSPILLLGEGTSGTLLKELVEKGFSNLRSIDVLYKALDRNYEKNYSARENGDAANLKNVASNSQKLVLSKDLLGSAPESKVYPILTETIRVLAPQGEARHSFVGIETSILLDAAAVILSNNDIRVEVVTTNSKKHEGYIKIIKNTSASKNKSPFNFEEPPPPAAISLALLTTIVEGKTLARKPKNIEGISTQYRLSFNNHYEKQWELLFKKVLSQIVTVTLSERFIDKLRIYFNEKVRKPLENGNSSLAASNLAILDSLTAQVKVLRTYSFKERPFYLIDGNLDDKQFLIPSETGIQDINTVPSLDYYNSVSDINRRLKNYNWGDGKNDDSP